MFAAALIGENSRGRESFYLVGAYRDPASGTRPLVSIAWGVCGRDDTFESKTYMGPKHEDFRDMKHAFYYARRIYNQKRSDPNMSYREVFVASPDIGDPFNFGDFEATWGGSITIPNWFANAAGDVAAAKPIEPPTHRPKPQEQLSLDDLKARIPRKEESHVKKENVEFTPRPRFGIKRR